MRDCKGIKILLDICPSSHRGEDFLPQPKVFWNLRLSCMNVLPSLFLPSQFPACWASCYLPCAGFSSLFSFHWGSFCWVGLLLCLASASRVLSWGCFSQVKSKKWHKICRGSVKFPWFCLAAAKIWNDRPVLQLSYSSEFYLARKGNYTLEIWRQADPKGEASICLGFFLLYVCLLFTLSLPYANWVSQEGGLFVWPELLSPVGRYSFVPFLQAFPFLCLLATAFLDSFFLY